MAAGGSLIPPVLPPPMLAERLLPLPATAFLLCCCCCTMVSFKKAGVAEWWLYLLFICSLNRRMFSCSSSSFCEGVEKLCRGCSRFGFNRFCDAFIAGSGWHSVGSFRGGD
uniref:Putative secreted protein n=1 Tax=Anopheles marajoara TaxID=58244 RepID=A0A2M4C855_9DIPT